MILGGLTDSTYDSPVYYEKLRLYVLRGRFELISNRVIFNRTSFVISTVM